MAQTPLEGSDAAARLAGQANACPSAQAQARMTQSPPRQMMAKVQVAQRRRGGPVWDRWQPQLAQPEVARGRLLAAVAKATWATRSMRASVPVTDRSMTGRPQAQMQATAGGAFGCPQTTLKRPPEKSPRPRPPRPPPPRLRHPQGRPPCKPRNRVRRAASAVAGNGNIVRKFSEGII